MKILIVGDIVGSPGRRAFEQVVGRMREAGEIDFVVANAENAAGGRGLTPALAAELFAAGADVLTLGDHAWNQKGLVPYIENENRLIRPANFAPGCPGRGWTTVATDVGLLTVINLIGRVFMPPFDCPFRAVDAILRDGSDHGRIVLVDMHAEATSEKKAMGRYLDGRVSVVVGTHTHVQTNDAAVLPRGTGYITDLGMTGPQDSIIGMTVDPIVGKFLSGMPVKFQVADRDVVLQGAVADIDPKTGRATGVVAIQQALQ